MLSAFRLAEPDSWWAERFYGEEKMERARRRWEDDQTALQGPNDPARGLDAARFDADSPSVRARCTICNRVFVSEEQALAHADRVHIELPFDEAKAAIEFSG